MAIDEKTICQKFKVKNYWIFYAVWIFVAVVIMAVAFYFRLKGHNFKLIFGIKMTYHKQYRYEIPRIGGLIVFFISILSAGGVVALYSMLPPYFGNVFFVVFIGLALLGLFLFFKYYYHIEVTDQTITFKENILSSKTTTLYYHQIKQLEKIEIYKIPALQFFFNKKKFIISSQGFKNIDDFNEIFTFLQNKVH